jgi:AcrR family transcriptional regulator
VIGSAAGGGYRRRNEEDVVARTSGAIEARDDGDDDLQEATRVRILEGTLEAIGRHGLRKLGMTDVALVSKVSRGTVYRYFPSKEILLESLFEYERHRFERSVNDLLASVPPGPDRLNAHIGFVLDYLRNHPALAGLIETEPRYVLGFLDQHYESFRRATGAMLEPSLRDSPLLRDAGVSFESLSDLLCRVLLTFFLLPSPARQEATSLHAVSAIMLELASVRATGAPGRRAAKPRKPSGASPASGAKHRA